MMVLHFSDVLEILYSITISKGLSKGLLCILKTEYTVAQEQTLTKQHQKMRRHDDRNIRAIHAGFETRTGNPGMPRPRKR